jgi:hypothetical protein
MAEARHGTTSSRWAPELLIAGAGILFARTVALIAGGARKVLQPWVVGLTYLEMAIDLVSIATAARWCRSRQPDQARWALRAGAAATFLHAGRVAVFVIGRTGPWVDFDVREEQRDGHDERWTWPQVVFAGTMSALGVVGVLVIGLVRRRRVAVGTH